MGKPLAIFAKDQDSVPSTTKGLVTVTSVFPGTLNTLFWPLWANIHKHRFYVFTFT